MELIYLNHYKIGREAKMQIFEYITCFYNGKRISLFLGLRISKSV
ncbi:IS3 family transposase [Paenibacillus peoriae]